MKRHNVTSVLALLTLSLGLASSQAQTTATATAPAAKPVEKSWADQVKNPTSWWSWGMDLRVRNEYINNGITLAASKSDNAVVGKKVHEQDYLRFRERLWTAFNLVPEQDLKLNARLAAEPRVFLTGAGFTPLVGHKGFDGTEGIVDSLNVSWKNILKQPLNITVGRQDIKLGDGWLVGDGTPLDGSWTYFLDSARATLEFKEANTAIEAIGIIQDKRDNGWMPVINAGQERLLTEQNEKGAILNVVNNAIKEMNVTGFFIYKHDDADFNARSFAAGGKVRAPDEADIYTFGMRFNGKLNDHWSYWLEGAYQWGKKQDKTIIRDDAILADATANNSSRNLRAYGVNAKLIYAFNDSLKNTFTLGGEFLSGDDPSTKEDEMFDVLWGRWPRWSELGLYSFAKETRIGQMANLGRIGPMWTFNPCSKTEMSLGYYALFAPETVATRAAPGLTSNVRDGDLSDHFRGHFATAILKYQFNRHLAGHLWSEFMFPGSYYQSTGAAEWNRMWTFMRAELSFTF